MINFYLYKFISKNITIKIQCSFISKNKIISLNKERKDDKL